MVCLVLTQLSAVKFVFFRQKGTETWKEEMEEEEENV